MRGHSTHNGFQEMKWALVRHLLLSSLFTLLGVALLIFIMLLIAKAMPAAY